MTVISQEPLTFILGSCDYVVNFLKTLNRGYYEREGLTLFFIASICDVVFIVLLLVSCRLDRCRRYVKFRNQVYNSDLLWLQLTKKYPITLLPNNKLMASLENILASSLLKTRLTKQPTKQNGCDWSDEPICKMIQKHPDFYLQRSCQVNGSISLSVRRRMYVPSSVLKYILDMYGILRTLRHLDNLTFVSCDFPGNVTSREM